QDVITEIRPHLPGRNSHVGRSVGRQAESAEPTERDGAQVRLAETVGLEHLAARRVERVQRIWNRHVVDLRRGKQSARVVAQAEDRRAVRGLVTAYAF